MPGRAKPGVRPLRAVSSRYEVTLGVPRAGGWREWAAVRSVFQAHLAGLEGPAVEGTEIASEVRRGRDYVRVVVLVNVTTADVAEALSVAWDAFLEAARDDIAGWDMASATAEVRPLYSPRQPELHARLLEAG